MLKTMIALSAMHGLIARMVGLVLSIVQAAPLVSECSEGSLHSKVAEKYSPTSAVS